MKSYLSLVAEYEREHKKKSRLTVICIAISVMLVTAIFGMADMSIKAQTDEFIRQQGNFHAILTGLTDDVAERIDNQGDVAVSGWLGIAEDIDYQGKKLIVQGGTEALAKEMNLTIKEGSFPASIGEALLDQQGLEQFNISIGDTIQVPLSDGQVRQYKITGTYHDFSSLKGTDVHGLFLSVDDIRAFPKEQYSEYYYIQFKSGVNINRALAEIKAEYKLTEDQVSPNKILLGLMGQSDDSMMVGIYLTAGVLFVLVTLAGTFMISSSFNMSILERTQFFGLLRCLGATKKQIKRYIRLEGFRYCLRGIPLGLLAGCAVLWAAIFFLNSLNTQYLPQMSMFKVSWPGIAAGAAIGLLVVMISSSSPAKRAAKVSPQSAVTGNINNTNSPQINRATSTRFFRVDSAMGIHHAFSNKKSLTLVAGSFALSIALLLSFTVLITFMNHALKPIKPYAPDLSLMMGQESMLLPSSLAEELRALPSVEAVYGRMICYDIPATDKQGNGTAMLVSYDGLQLEWAKEMVLSGSVEDVEKGNGVLVDYEYAQAFNWEVGDAITLSIAGEPRQMRVSAIISDVPFEVEVGGWVMVCAEPAFTALTGITNYTIIDMQVDEDISSQVRKLLPSGASFFDYQQKNNEVKASFYAMAVFVYGLLLVIALVALINILNTVNASVSSRMNHYGVMRAVGMSAKQLERVIRAEAVAYAVTGSVFGSVLGLLLHKFFYTIMITENWGDIWQPPLDLLALAIFGSVAAALIAVIFPAKNIEKMSIVNVVNAG